MATSTPRSKSGQKQRHYVATFNGKNNRRLTRRPGVAVPPWYVFHLGSPDPLGEFNAPIQLDSHNGPRELNEAELYQWFAAQIQARPQYVATMTWIEQIAYLDSLKAPEPLPTFAALESEWRTHCKASDKQRRKVLHDWRDFVKTSKVKSLTDIKPTVVIAYRDAVFARGMVGISQRNLFSRIRRFVSFAKSRAIAMDACAKALQSLELLTLSERVVSLNPKPIEVDDWRALLRNAKGDNRALLLVMLNCGMYLAEAVRLKWSDIRDGCVIAHRTKTGSCVRVAVLWQETIDALAKRLTEGRIVALRRSHAA